MRGTKGFIDLLIWTPTKKQEIYPFGWTRTSPVEIIANLHKRKSL